jgi:hypothetical protein
VRVDSRFDTLVVRARNHVGAVDLWVGQVLHGQAVNVIVAVVRVVVGMLPGSNASFFFLGQKLFLALLGRLLVLLLFLLCVLR